MVEEKYGLCFQGKRESILRIHEEQGGILQISHMGGKGNLYIEGDSLDALKALKKDYQNKIRVIYIDPPYNTGNSFIYADNFRKRDHPHDKWLEMMYPRLFLSRELLSQDGVIFISIGSFELANLKLLCDEIFGQENFIDIFVWNKTETPPSLSKKTRQTVEFILCYEKQKNNNKYYGNRLDNGDAPLINTANYIQEVFFPKASINIKFMKDGILKKGVYDKAEVMEDIIINDNINQNVAKIKARFKWNQQKIQEEFEKGTGFLIKSDKISIRFQRNKAYGSKNFKPPCNYLWQQNGAGTNESAKRELKALGMEDWFDYPKPVSLIKLLIKMVLHNDKNGIVLDFFSGSATTAHAVIALNREDLGERRFILVQTPDKINEKSIAYQNGMRTICDIGRERINRCSR